MRWLAVTSLLLTVSCSRRDESSGSRHVPGPKPAFAPTLTRDCGKRADVLAAKVKRLAGDAPPVSWHRNAMPTSSVGRPVDTPGPVILIDRGEVTYNAEPMGEDGQDLGERHQAELRGQVRRGRKLGDGAMGAHRPLYVHAPPTIELHRLTSVLGHIDSARSFRLLVKAKREGWVDPLTGAPSRVRKVIAEIKAADDPGQGAVRIAEETEKAIGVCAPIIELFGSVAMADAQDKAKLIAENIAKSLRDCDCNLADLDMFEYLLVAVMDVGDTVQRYVPLSLAGEGIPVELAATATVAELVAAVEALPDAALTTGIALRLSGAPRPR